MNKAKGFFNKMGLSGSDAPSTNSAIMKESKNRYGMGLGNTPAGVMPVSTASNATPGYLGQWGEDRYTNIAIIIRGFQVVLIFCMLITVIVLATFQTKWIGKMSGLTGLLLVITLVTFVFSGFLLATSFAPGSLQDLTDRIIRNFEQPRLGLVMNGTGLIFWFILSVTQTASALSSKACKDPSADPHAKSSKGNHDDYVKQLPSFCHTKKAGAAFCWLIFLTCLGTMLLFLRFWKLSRKNGPRIPPFVHPADEGDFQPIADEMDGEAYDAEAYGHNGGAYNPPSNRYGDGGDGRYAYSETAQVAGYPAGQNGRYDPGPESTASYTRTDPFADSTYVPRQSYDYGAYGGNPQPDPYAAIQSQLRSDRPPQLPPLYRG